MRSPEPESDGDRATPPPRLAVLVGGQEPPDRHGIALCLSVLAEESAYATAFARLGWHVQFVEDILDLLIVGLDSDVAILMTDALDESIEAKRDGALTADLVIVVDGDEEAEAAWSAGADWVVVRPIYLKNPLGS